jgi:hypothetical protein
VTVVFAAVMALVFGAIGLFVYLRFSAELDNTIDSGLPSRAADLATLVGDRQRRGRRARGRDSRRQLGGRGGGPAHLAEGAGVEVGGVTFIWA